MMLAERAYSRLLEVQLDVADALQFMAGSQLGRGNSACAIERLLTAPRAQPHDASSLHQRGEGVAAAMGNVNQSSESAPRIRDNGRDSGAGNRLESNLSVVG